MAYYNSNASHDLPFDTFNHSLMIRFSLPYQNAHETCNFSSPEGKQQYQSNEKQTVPWKSTAQALTNTL